MSQNDFNIANQDGASYRADVNLALQALASQSAGTTEPSTTYAYQVWGDTTTGLIKVRNGANNAWVIMGQLADSTKTSLFSSNLERLTIISDGKVGIGDTTPSYELDVAGDINCTGAFKVNGVDIPTEAGLINAGTTGGSATAYTATPSPAIAAYAANQIFAVFIHTTNTTTSPTINVSTLGAKNLKKQIGGSKVNPAVGDLQANTFALIGYDGTDAIIINPRTHSQGANIASASTVNLDTATGDYVHVTGTTSITAITLSQGREGTVVFDGVLTLTNGASLILPSAANITTAAGDSAVFRGEASGVVRCISYTKADGTAVVGGGGTIFQAQHRQASGTSGGTLTLNTNTKVPLNTVVQNTISGASMASSVITLPAGTYEILDAYSYGYKLGNFHVWLQNTTDGTVVQDAGGDDLIGSVPYSSGSDFQSIASFITGNPQFTLAGTKNIELQIRSTQSTTTHGLGYGLQTTLKDNLFAQITLKKVA